VAPTGRNLGKRADSRATRQRLLIALRRLLDHGQADLTLQTVAEEAGVSTATAYRYFGSAQDAVLAYILEFPEQVAAAYFERGQGEQGLDRLYLWCQTWITLIDEGWGASLVYLRSPEGFLARRAKQDAVISAVCRHIEPLMRDALDELRITQDKVEVALFLWNLVYDPREILDLRRTLHWTRSRIEQSLWAMLLGSLNGYVESRSRP
jgi:AcrR family transcriptional regulator